MQSIILLTEASGFDRFGGLPLWSRLVRSLRQRGAAPIRMVVAAPLRGRLPAGDLQSARDRVDEITTLSDPHRPPTTEQLLAVFPDAATEVLVVPAERVTDPRILQEVLEARRNLAVVDCAPPNDQSALLAPASCIPEGLLVGPVRIDRQWLESHPGELVGQITRGLATGSLEPLDVARLPTYAGHLRRHLRPFWFPAPTERTREQARELLLHSTQKGALDIPAIFHAPIEKRLAWSLADTRITPNQITVLTNLVAWSATVLFFRGELGWGLAAALAVGVMDGVDGKLARLRLETSRLGELEHWFDFLYEWSWWAALAHYLSSSGLLPGAWQVFGWLALAEVVDGLAKWANLRAFGRTIDEMGRFDLLVRWVGGRRNIYIWLLAGGALIGRLPGAFGLLPWLEGATAVVHCLRFSWHSRRRRATGDRNRDAIGSAP